MYRINGIAFNEDCSCFTAAHSRGFKVFNADPVEPWVARDFGSEGGLACAAVSDRTNYLVLVGGDGPRMPRTKVLVWNDETAQSSALNFDQPVSNALITREVVVCVLERSVQIFSLAPPHESRLKIPTAANPRGLAALHAGLSVVPSKEVGQVALVQTNPAAGAETRGGGSCLGGTPIGQPNPVDRVDATIEPGSHGSPQPVQATRASSIDVQRAEGGAEDAWVGSVALQNANPLSEGQTNKDNNHKDNSHKDNNHKDNSHKDNNHKDKERMKNETNKTNANANKPRGDERTEDEPRNDPDDPTNSDKPRPTDPTNQTDTFTTPQVVPSPQVVAISPCHRSPIAALAINARCVATASQTGTLVHVFDLRTQSSRFFRRGLDRARIFSLASAPTSARSAVSSDKRTSHVFDIASTAATDAAKPAAAAAKPPSNRAGANERHSLAAVAPHSYFGDEWSFARLKTRSKSRGVLAWTAKDSLVVVRPEEAQWEKYVLIGTTLMAEAWRNIR